MIMDFYTSFPDRIAFANCVDADGWQWIILSVILAATYAVDSSLFQRCVPAGHVTYNYKLYMAIVLCFTEV